MQPENLKSGDSEDLEALFDSIAAESAQKPAISAKIEIEPEKIFQPGDEAIDDEDHDVFHRIGGLTRSLHDALRELGYDKAVEGAVDSLPDARARLAYIANLTGQAAEKVLAAVEVSQNLQDQIYARAKSLDMEFDRLFAQEMDVSEFRSHVLTTHQFLKDLQKDSMQTNSQLTEIMLAQDFHDLTGQVVNRIATMAQNLEDQLVKLLLAATPKERRPAVDEMWLSGPAVSTEGRTDICVDQNQVDDLLESLGF
ncbi:MAG: protein phosphatase CheZ [Burkholderiales bacterium]|nr:protein phosphatase CheZ [Burkholderiales bacterium]